ncbi:hypothetical protein Goshw_012336, partial [Gossypium schwendimanii]|nr:hypothetical protein [Gossypium schwendimanii]
MKEMLELVERHTDGFDSMEEQLRDFLLDSLGANAEKMNELVNSTMTKLAERDENLEDMVPKQQAMDVSKPEKLKGARSARDVESFVELGPTKDKFESSKPNGKGNGERNHEEDEEGHSDDGNSIDSTSGNGKPRDTKWGSNNSRDKGKRIKCFICQGPYMAR